LSAHYVKLVIMAMAEAILLPMVEATLLPMVEAILLPMAEAILLPMVEVASNLNAVPVVVVVLANAAVNTVFAVPPQIIAALDVKAVPVVPPILLPMVEVASNLNAVQAVVVVLANVAVNTVFAVPPQTIVELDVKAVPVVPPILLLQIMVMVVVKAVVSNGPILEAGLGPVDAIFPEVRLT